MKIKNVDLNDENWARHLVGDCDIDCKFCIEEEDELNRKPSKKEKEK